MATISKPVVQILTPALCIVCRRKSPPAKRQTDCKQYKDHAGSAIYTGDHVLLTQDIGQPTARIVSVNPQGGFKDLLRFDQGIWITRLYQAQAVGGRCKSAKSIKEKRSGAPPLPPRMTLAPLKRETEQRDAFKPCHY